MKLKGVYVAIVSPFEPSGRLDTDALGSHLKHLASSGVHGLVPCGTTGEGPTLSAADRAILIDTCVDFGASHGMEVIAGCGGNNTETVAQTILDAERRGCDGTLVVTPYYNKPTAEGLRQHYLALAEQATKPLVLYHVPGRTAVGFSLETVRELFSHPRIVGIKEASGQYAYWLGLAEVAKETGRSVLAGDDDAFAVCGALGGTGIISASANALAREYVRLFDLMEADQWRAAFDLQRALVPMVRAFFSETSPAPLKYFLSKHHSMHNQLRLPLVPASEKAARQVDAAWETLRGRGVLGDL